MYTLKDSDGLHDKYGKQMTICDLSGATQKHLSLNRTEKRWVHFKQRSDKSSNSESSVFFASTTRKRTLFIDWTKWNWKEFQKVSIFVLDFSVGMRFSFFSDVISKGVVLPCPNAFRFHEWVSAWRRVKSIRLFSLERSENGWKIPKK